MNLCLPRNPTAFSSGDLSAFFGNLLIELDACGLTTKQRDLLSTKAILGRFLDPATRPFFLYHFSAIIEKAIRTVFARTPHPRVLELGCGSGSVSLLFALLGANVTALDLDPDAVDGCKKRQLFYERHAGVLPLRFEAADAFHYPYASTPPFDVIYSLFAVNMMRPTGRLLDLVCPAVRPGGVLFISDGNTASLYNRIFRSRPCLSPQEMAAALTRHRLVPLETTYQCILPARVCRSAPLLRFGKTCERTLQRLGLMSRFGVSYNIVAQAI